MHGKGAHATPGDHTVLYPLRGSFYTLPELYTLSQLPIPLTARPSARRDDLAHVIPQQAEGSQPALPSLPEELPHLPSQLA